MCLCEWRVNMKYKTICKEISLKYIQDLFIKKNNEVQTIEDLKNNLRIAYEMIFDLTSKLKNAKKAKPKKPRTLKGAP